MADDDGELSITLDEPEPKKPAIKGKVKYDEDEPNLVEIFKKSETGRAWLKRLVARAFDDFEEDWESTEQYRRQMASDFQLFAGTMPKKEFPFKDCANAHLPYMLENLSRLQFRASAELFGDWRQPFGVVPIGNSQEDQEIVDVLTVHGNWQIRENMPDFRRQVGDRGLLLYFFAGDVTCHSYYDPVTRRNVHEMLTCDEFVTPYTHVTVQPDYSDLPHRTKIMYRYRHQLQQMRGEWVGIDTVLSREPPEWDDEPVAELEQAVAQNHAVDIPTDQKHAPYKILQYEGWLEMPPSTQEGKAKARDRFVQLVYDHTTRTPMGMRILEEAPWNERERFERQSKELEQLRQGMAQFEQAQAQGQMRLQQLQQELQLALAMPEPPMGMAPPMMGPPGPMGQALGQGMGQAPMGPPAQPGMMGPGPMAPPPMPRHMQIQQQIDGLTRQLSTMQPPPLPPWLEPEDIPQDGDLSAIVPLPPRKEPIHMFSHAVCIEPLKGNLGLSYGRIQAEYNRAADTTLSQFIDSATLGNVWCMITDNVVQFEKGAKITPGGILKATGFTGNINDHIKELRPGPANQQMFDIIRFMQEIGQSSIQAPDVLSGESGKSGETYRGIATRIEQATKQLTVATQKYAAFVRQILKNNARLNAHFLPEEEMRYLMDYRAGQMRQIKIERRLYERNYDVQFESDLKYSPQQQKIAEADELVQMAMGVPQLQQNHSFAYEAVRKSLEARDKEDMVPLLGRQPPPPPMFGMPTMPMMMGPQPGAQPPGPGKPGPGKPANGNGGGGGPQPPSPGVASGPAPEGGKPQPKLERVPGKGGPVVQA